MNKTGLLSLLSLLGTTIGVAQQPQYTYGTQSLAEWKLTQYEPEPDASAVVLFDKGVSKFVEDEGGYSIEFTRSRKIKILAEAGLEYAQVSIPYYVDGYGKTERIVKIEAKTYNREQGNVSVHALSPNQVFDELKSKHWREVKFAFPQARPGSILEFSYTLKTPFHFNLPDWKFQDLIPTVYSEYQVSMIPFYEYEFIAQGLTHFDFQDSQLDPFKRSYGQVAKVYGQNMGSGVEFNDLVYTFVKKRVPAFKDEAYITSVEDYIMKLDFQLARFNHPNGGTEQVITTYQALSEALLKNPYFGKYLKASEKQGSRLLAEIKPAGLEGLALCEAIVKHIKQHYNWNGQVSKYSSGKLKEVLTSRSGNSADINLLLIGSLRAAGFSARPVIISTRSHGKIKTNYPFGHFFNNVLVLVEAEGSTFITDGTLAALAFNRIPPYCINEQGLVVDEKQVAWVSLENGSPSKNEYQISSTLNLETGMLESQITNSRADYEAFAYRYTYRDKPEQLKQALEEKGLHNITALSSQDYHQPEAPYRLEYQAQLPLEIVGNKILLSPLLSFPIKENKLQQAQRSYPVDLGYSYSLHIQNEIALPKGYQLVELPAPYTANDELVSVYLQFDTKEGKIRAYGYYTLKKTTYSPQEYHRLKQHFDRIVENFNRKLVLEKRT